MGVRRLVGSDPCERAAQHAELHQPQPGVGATQVLENCRADRFVNLIDDMFRTATTCPFDGASSSSSAAYGIG